MINPKKSDAGNPTANTFNAGAAREITPIAELVNNKVTIAGRAIITPPEKMRDDHCKIAQSISLFT
jgi:hypothetical protein